MSVERAINTTSHLVDLSDGRMVAPGAVVENVPLNPHNRALLNEGTLAVVGLDEAVPEEDDPEPGVEPEPEINPFDREDS